MTGAGSAGPTFTEWLLAHRDEQTAIGDLARDVAEDPAWPRDASSWQEVRGYLQLETYASEDVLATAREAARRWSSGDAS